MKTSPFVVNCMVILLRETEAQKVARFANLTETVRIWLDSRPNSEACKPFGELVPIFLKDMAL